MAKSDVLFASEIHPREHDAFPQDISRRQRNCTDWVHPTALPTFATNRKIQCLKILTIYLKPKIKLNYSYMN